MFRAMNDSKQPTFALNTVTSVSVYGFWKHRESLPQKTVSRNRWEPGRVSRSNV